mmetsp:Transcript_23543/g.27013  ORF Transcript_23543/g.27013 Transcript_23543/m.27013 type:complete len:424 (-) Transcript_23543:220-1491(-)
MPSRGSTTTRNPEVFDAPRPAVTLKLGKKRTDELIRADGDTWDEYLAVCEKADNTHASTASGGGSATSAALSFFGKKKKNNGKKGDSKPTSSATNNLIIRSYYQNRRTEKKVWDEPPSGASKIVPASEEMRHMADIQLNEFYVATTAINVGNTIIGDIESTGTTGADRYDNGDNTSKKKKSLVEGFFRRNSDDGRKKGLTGGNGGANIKRIQYKPRSNLLMDCNVSNSSRRNSNRNRSTLNYRQLQEAIARSCTDIHGSGGNEIVDNINFGETEEEILRRVLEDSRLEAMSKTTVTIDRHQNITKSSKRDSTRQTSSRGSSSSTPQVYHDNYGNDDRKLLARTKSNTSTNPVGIFDPYSESHIASCSSLDERHWQQQQQNLQLQGLMKPSPTSTSSSSPKRLSSITRRSGSSTKKLQDRAGLV